MNDAEEKRRLSAYINPARDSTAKAYVLYDHARRGKWEGYNIDSMKLSYEQLAINSRQRVVEFIRHNPDSYAALQYFKDFILNSFYFKRDSVISIYSYFNNDLKASRLGKSINEILITKKSLSINALMPDFAFRAATGEALRLSSFRNQKHVLLCFWDSWCAPCIRSIPTLKKLAEAYGGNLQLIHVSIDNDKTKWLTSLQKYPMPWLQTLDLVPYITGSKAREVYDVHFIPQYFLIDKEGRLLYQNVLNDDNDDYTILQNMLKKILN